MSIELPPLPRAAHVKVHTDSDGFEYWKEPHYTADQMRAYAMAAVLAERERCAKVCDEIETAAWNAWKATYNTYHDGRSDGAGECAAAIRAETTN